MEYLLRAALLALTLASMYLYFPLNKGRARYFFESDLDRRIPFVPQFIIFYVAFLPLSIAGLFLLYPTPFAIAGYLALIIAVLAGSFVRYFVHNGIRQPQIRHADISSRIVHWLYLHDDRAHTFPSTHVLVTLTMSYFLAAAFPTYAPLVWAVAVLIVLSTLFVKQHYLADVIGGALFAVGAIYSAGLIIQLVS